MVEKLTDEKLMARFQKGEMQAFEVLLNRHRKGVYNFVYRFVHNPAAAEDAVQDVFLRMVASRQSFEKRSKFTTWLYTIARNLCIDHLRKQKHRKHLSLDQPTRPDGESEMTLMDRVGSKDALPDQQADDSQVREKILGAIAELSEEQREVFLMREQAGLPFEEIARIVRAPLNTVKSRMRYALQNLRARLEAQGVEL